MARPLLDATAQLPAPVRSGRKPPAFAAWLGATAACALCGIAPAQESPTPPDGAPPLDQARWEFAQPADFAATGLVRFAVPREAIDAARHDFADLRLINREGREVPLVTTIPRPGAAESEPVTADGHALRVSLENAETRITFRSSTALDVRAIALTTPAARFVKAARLLVGDGEGTEVVERLAGVPLFREPGGASQLEVPVPDGGIPPGATVAIVLDDSRSPPIPITGVTLAGSRPAPFPPQVIAVSILERIERGGRTRLLLDFGARHLDLAGIDLSVATGAFLRGVRLVEMVVANGELGERALHSGVIQRDGAASHAQPVDFPIEGRLPRRTAWLVIDNGDSPPLRIDSISARVRPVHGIAQIATPGEHRLLAGRPDAAPPRYDLARMRDATAAQALDPTITFAPLERTPDWIPPDPLRGVPSLGAPIDTERWSFRKSVRAAAAGSIVFALDLEALAGARSDLGDLRLVRDGRQAPFVLDRRFAAAVPVPLDPGIEPDTERPSISRWILRLPRPAIPLAEISCAIATPLFDRRAVLLEAVDDRRGGTSRRILGRADWVGSPESPRERRFTIPLEARPTTGRLVLEIDNGDNAPIEPVDFRALADGARVHFRADSPGEWLLCYGNPGASLPVYDLGAAATALIEGDPAVAALGPEIQVSAVPWSASRPLTGVRRWLFWGALATAAAGLLFIIVRLLPARGAPGRDGGS